MWLLGQVFAMQKLVVIYLDLRQKDLLYCHKLKRFHFQTEKWHFLRFGFFWFRISLQVPLVLGITSFAEMYFPFYENKFV